MIIFTSAIIKNFYDQRKQEYINSFNTLTNMGYFNKIHIVECVDDGNTKTFLDKLTKNVFYTKKKYNFKNKGVNEILNIKNFLDNTVIDNDQKIIKLTGRYELMDNSFLKECDDTSNDVILKKDSLGQVFFGCFCVTKKILIDFISNVDWDVVESRFICIERVFADYLIEKKIKIKELQNINIKCNINNNDLNIL